MAKDKFSFSFVFDREFHFESYGVKIKIESNSNELLNAAERIINDGIPGSVRFIENENGASANTFSLMLDGGVYTLFHNGKQVTEGGIETRFLKYFSHVVRVEVAEHAVSKVFLHAGVVGWKGRAIVLPAKSFSGKTTLTAELVRNGADYYSDEYAVLDERGHVHAFPRKLSMRYFGATREKDISVEELGGSYGLEPIPVGMVLLTEFEKSAVWEPQFLSAGKGIMEILPHTIPIRSRSEFSLKVLDIVASRAIIVKSARSDAKKFAKSLLAFFENNIN